jgi:hypothetical protein
LFIRNFGPQLHSARPEIFVIAFLLLTFGVEESRELPTEGSILLILYILKREAEYSVSSGCKRTNENAADLASTF